MKKFLRRIATATLCIPAAFGLLSCLSTGSITGPVEPALVVENAALPDGTVVSVQLFATATEVQAWWKQLHPEKLHAKYELTDRNSTAAQSTQSIWAKSTDSNGYFKNEYSAADFGELATIMQENALPYGRGELFIGTELRSIYFCADKKYKKFSFLRVDYLDEEGEKALQAIKDEEKAAQERKWAEAYEQIEKNKAASPRAVVTTTVNTEPAQITKTQKQPQQQ